MDMPQLRHVHDRDISAAKNIKKDTLSTLGIRGIYACGDLLRPLTDRAFLEQDRSMAKSMKQEAPP